MERLTNTINTILWGKVFVVVKNSNQYDTDGYIHPEGLSFILRALSLKESNYINYVYETELQNAINGGILSIDSLSKYYKEVGIWNEDREKQIDLLQKQKEFLNKELEEAIGGKKKKLERELKSTTEKLEDLLMTKAQLFWLSAENRADEVMRRHIVMLCAENMEQSKLWDTQKNFSVETNTALIAELATLYYKHHILEESILRKVARSPEWRVKWTASKSGADLFGKPIPEWSEMQNMLVYWSQYYDFVFDSHERPKDHIIEDDKLCDGWVKSQLSKTKFSPTKERKERSKKNHQEHFIFARDKETIEEIQKMNTPDVRQQLKNESKIIKQKGRVSEYDLRKGLYATGIM